MTKSAPRAMAVSFCGGRAERARFFGSLGFGGGVIVHTGCEGEEVEDAVCQRGVLDMVKEVWSVSALGGRMVEGGEVIGVWRIRVCLVGH